MPIDKIVGRVYLLFGVVLVAMALGLMGALLIGGYEIPEMTTFHNYQLDPVKLPIIPALFIPIACRAISGFQPLGLH